MNREFSRKPAGLRTHILVSGAAALIVNLGQVAAVRFGQLPVAESLRYDPLRLFVAIITDVSFLGAGTIIRQADKNRVEGLTTAASLLFSAAIGMAVAFSQYLLSSMLAVFVLLILWALGKADDYLEKLKPDEKECETDPKESDNK